MPAGPEMKMKMKILMLMEEDLHFLELQLAACELQTTTRHELDVCSLRGSCSQGISNSAWVVKLRFRVISDGDASCISSFLVSMLETRRVSKLSGARRGDLIAVAVHVADLATYVIG
jgi:hypothetical protein